MKGASLMYNGIGGKIKGLAKFIGIGGAIIFLILGIIFCIVADDAPGRSADQYWTLAITFFVLIPASLLASFPLYGFGELVENVGQIAKNTAQPGVGIRPQTYKPTNSGTYPPVVSNDLPEL